MRSARRPSSRSGGDDRPQVEVRDLYEAHAVECCGKAFRADLHPADAQRRAAQRSSPEQCDGNQCGRDVARTAPSDEAERVTGQARQDGEQPRPEEPHRRLYDRRGVVAAQRADKDRRQGQQVGDDGPYDAAGRNGPPPPEPVEMVPVGRHGCGHKDKYRYCEKHLLFGDEVLYDAKIRKFANPPPLFLAYDLRKYG